MKCVVILDNGHGVNTPGKCSPDKSILEYKWTRELAARLKQLLDERGHESVILVPEETDIPLTTGKDNRCKRANAIYSDCKKSGKTAILISLHLDAAGSGGKWNNASGFSVRVSLNASSKSKRLAQCIYDFVIQNKLQGNRSVPKEHYWKQNIGICRETNMPAVLGESLFQDCKQDAKYLLSTEGFETIAMTYLDGIEKFMKEFNYD